MIRAEVRNTQRTFKGRTPKEVVYRMMRADFITRAKEDYMKEVAERVKQVYRRSLRLIPGDHERFLKELKRVGLITLHTEQ